MLKKSNAMRERVGYVGRLSIHHFKGSFTFSTAHRRYASSSLVFDDNKVPTEMSAKSTKSFACFCTTWLIRGVNRTSLYLPYCLVPQFCRHQKLPLFSRSWPHIPHALDFLPFQSTRRPIDVDGNILIWDQGVELWGKSQQAPRNRSHYITHSNPIDGWEIGYQVIPIQLFLS